MTSRRYAAAVEALHALFEKSGECPKCEVRQFFPMQFVNDGGHITYPLVCALCGYRARVMVPKRVIAQLELEAPELARAWALPHCAVCGALGAEEHHWAPWSKFGEESERWPTSPLCQRCHARWHQVMTPAG